MILNAWTVLAFFLAGFTALISLVLVSWCARAMLRRGSSWDSGGPLVSLLLGTLVAIGIVGLPHPYWLLKSYVPALADAGAMCAYGVAAAHPRLVGAVLALGPMMVWTGGLWFVSLRAADPKKTALRPGLPFLAGVLGLLYASAEALYLLTGKGATPVTCCSQALSGASGSLALSGAGSTGLSLGWSSPLVYWVASLALLLFMGVLVRRPPRPLRYPALRAAALSVAAVLSATQTFFFWRDHLAPRVLELPYHRCVFELLTDTRALWLAAALLAAGYGVLLWPAALLRTKRGAEVTRGIHKASLLALCSGQLIVLVHWPTIH